MGNAYTSSRIYLLCTYTFASQSTTFSSFSSHDIYDVVETFAQAVQPGEYLYVDPKDSVGDLSDSRLGLIHFLYYVDYPTGSPRGESKHTNYVNGG